MSESVSYRAAAPAESVREAVSSELKTRGIVFHDPSAWASARERVRQLEKHLQDELARQGGSVLSVRSDDNVVSQAFRKLQAGLAAFQRVEALSAYAAARYPERLSGLCREVRALQSGCGRGNIHEMPEHALNRLADQYQSLVADVHGELCRLERQVMLDTVSRSLGELGYAVETGRDALKATRGQTCIVAGVDSSGDLAMDMAGISGLSCIREMSRVEKMCVRKGMKLQRVFSTTHGKPEGGSLMSALKPLFDMRINVGSSKRNRLSHCGVPALRRMNGHYR